MGTVVLRNTPTTRKKKNENRKDEKNTRPQMQKDEEARANERLARYSTPELLQFLDRLEDGKFKGKYDFVYLPFDFKKDSIFGYAIVNLSSPDDALKFRDLFTKKEISLVSGHE